MFKRLAPLAILALPFMLVACSDDDNGVKPPTYDLTKLNAIKVTADPVADGVADAIWADAPVLTVALGDGMAALNCDLCHSRNSATTVTLKAVHSAAKLTILASWADDDASFTRGEAWSYSTGAWTKPNSDQSEDRIAFFWPIGAITGDGPGGSTGGCMTKCHTTDVHPETAGLEDEAHLATGTADSWHMKAARFLPATSATGSGLTIDAISHQVTGGTVSMTGWIDDKYNAQWSAANAPDGGRYADAGGGAESRNRIADKSRPKYMEKAPTDFMDAMILTQSEIDAGQTAGDATTGVSDADAAQYWPAYAASKAIVPERILKNPGGSRADIIQGGVWANGRWTVELQRTLTTSDTDHDIQFSLGQEYTFGVATMDNSGGDEHKTSTKHILKVLE